MMISGAAVHAARAQPVDTLRANGLRQPVEVLRDRWGVSHIYAANEHDLFFAQGYVAASDRLFQLELWRRQATGSLAELYRHYGIDTNAIVAAAQAIAPGRPIRHLKALP